MSPPSQHTQSVGRVYAATCARSHVEVHAQEHVRTFRVSSLVFPVTVTEVRLAGAVVTVAAVTRVVT